MYYKPAVLRSFPAARTCLENPRLEGSILDMMDFKELPPNEKSKAEQVEPLSSSLQISPQVRTAVTDKLFNVLGKLANENLHYPLWEDVYTNVHNNLKSARNSELQTYAHTTFCHAAEDLMSLKLLTRKQLDKMIAEARREIGE